MKLTSRREFIKFSSGLIGLTLTESAFRVPAKSPLLSFSTLGCPDWTFPTIVDFAVKNKYDGIEFRGIQRQLDLTKCPEFNSIENILNTKNILNANGLKVVDLGSSCELHHTDTATRIKHIDHGKKFIDLADQLNCPNVRVFPNKLPNDDQRQAVMELIIKGLLELGEYAKGTKVHILLESHGDAVKTNELKTMMESAEHPNVGLVWDIVNMWSVTKEPPADVYRELKKYIRHTHIKDANLVDGTPYYTLVGKGETPIFDAVDLLVKDGYSGYYSFEWEKLWHPEIGEPEIALADYPVTMRKHFESKS
ncbi:MAG: xylose isomerase [Bacteroidetes bacterium]|nr:MAG: xylose isomerase [Bacteroidota bacterium]